MPSAPTDEPRGDKAKQDGDHLKGVIRNQVLRTLGEPGGAGRVQVRPLWDNYYRVNVIVGADLGSVKIARSYFLETDGEGNIVESTPELTRTARTGLPGT